MLLALDARCAQRLLCCPDVCLRSRDKHVRERLPRLVEVKRQARVAARCLRQRACSRRPIFYGTIVGSRIAIASDKRARLVEVDRFRTGRAAAHQLQCGQLNRRKKSTTNRLVETRFDRRTRLLDHVQQAKSKTLSFLFSRTGS